MIYWRFQVLIDTSYSGSAISKAQEWKEENHDGYYFESACQLELHFFCSTGENELANDLGGDIRYLHQEISELRESLEILQQEVRTLRELNGT